VLEIWKDCVSAPGYKISNQGRILGKRGKILNPCLDSYGYFRPGLQTLKGQKSFYVHRLVAEAFIPNPENKPQVNHINGDKEDNRAENLEWCTSAENTYHADKIGLRDHKAHGESHYKAKLTEDQVIEIFRSEGKTHVQIGKEYGISANSVCRIKNRTRWSRTTKRF
jgi:hypothetical protein